MLLNLWDNHIQQLKTEIMPKLLQIFIYQMKQIDFSDEIFDLIRLKRSDEMHRKAFVFLDLRMLQELLDSVLTDRAYPAPLQMCKLTRLCVLDRRKQRYLTRISSCRACRLLYSSANLLDVSVYV